jgi:hypothetical protein
MQEVELRIYFSRWLTGGGYYTAELRWVNDHEEAWRGAADESRETVEKRAEQWAEANGWTIVSRTDVEN